MPDAVFATHGGELSFLPKARQLVFERVKKRLDDTGSDFAFAKDNVTAYWFSTDPRGGGWTVLLTTTLPDSIYYRVIHNAIAKETSVDVYHKFDTQTFRDEEIY
jgi:hypothetical protein